MKRLLYNDLNLSLAEKNQVVFTQTDLATGHEYLFLRMSNV